jgi:hypothetical protein
LDKKRPGHPRLVNSDQPPPSRSAQRDARHRSQPCSLQQAVPFGNARARTTQVHHGKAMAAFM